MRHVAAIDRDEVIVDARGRHERAALVDAWESTPGQVGLDLVGEAELMRVIGNGDDRPLTRYGETGVARAWLAAVAPGVLAEEDPAESASPAI